MIDETMLEAETKMDKATLENKDGGQQLGEGGGSEEETSPIAAAAAKKAAGRSR